MSLLNSPLSRLGAQVAKGAYNSVKNEEARARTIDSLNARAKEQRRQAEIEAQKRIKEREAIKIANDERRKKREAEFIAKEAAKPWNKPVKREYLGGDSISAGPTETQAIINKAYTSGREAAITGKDVGKGLAGGFARFGLNMGSGLDNLIGGVADIVGADEFAQAFWMAGGDASKLGEKTVDKLVGDSKAGRLAADVGEGAASIGAAVAGGVPAMAFMSGAGGADTYKEARDAGKGKLQSLATGMASGGIDFMLNKIGIEGVKGIGIVDDVAKKIISKANVQNKVAKKAFGTLFAGLGEGIEETASQYATSKISNISYDKAMPSFQDYVKTFTISAALGSGTHAIVSPFHTKAKERVINDMVKKGVDKKVASKTMNAIDKAMFEELRKGDVMGRGKMAGLKGLGNGTPGIDFEAPLPVKRKAIDKWSDLKERGDVVFHGTNADFETFSSKHLGDSTGTKTARQGFFFSNKEHIAQEYAKTGTNTKTVMDLKQKLADAKTVLKDTNSAKAMESVKKIESKLNKAVEKAKASKGKVVEAVINMNSPLEVDFNGKPFSESKVNKIIEDAKANGYDGVIIKNIDDSVDVGATGVKEENVGDLYVPFDTKSITTKQDYLMRDGAIAETADVILNDNDTLSVASDEDAIEYAKNAAIAEASKGRINRIKKYFKNINTDKGEFVKDAVFSVSERLGEINKTLKYAIRKYDHNLIVDMDRRLKNVASLTSKMTKARKKMPVDFAILDMAMKNRDTAVLDKQLKKMGLEDDYKKMRETLDEIYNDGVDSGLDINYMENLTPRIVADPEGLMTYLHGTDIWTNLEESISAKELKEGRSLSVEEKAHLANALLSGYSHDGITLNSSQHIKSRQIDKINAEMNKFYAGSDIAINNYVRNMTNLINARKFFGKSLEKMGDIDSSIGSYTLNLMLEGKIKPSQEKEVVKLLNARFNSKGTGKFFSFLKTMGYIETMGSPISTVTQLGDFAMTGIKNGAFNSIKGFKDAISGKNKVDAASIIGHEIAAEFSDDNYSSKLISSVFNATGLSKLDMFAKQTFVNSSVIANQQMLKNDPVKFMEKIKPMFGDRAIDVFKELGTGAINDDMRMIVFNDLADTAPISEGEMPVSYLTGGNARIMYMLKTYQTKLFNMYRQEIYLKLKSKNNAVKIEGAKNMALMFSQLVLWNAGADVIKDLLLGRDIKLGDKLVDNLLKLGMLSKYSIYKMKEGDTGDFIKSIFFPPTAGMDSLAKDLFAYHSNKDKLMEDGLESTKLVPLVGKPYYWWRGKGATKKKKKRIGDSAKAYNLYKSSAVDELNDDDVKKFNELLLQEVESGNVSREDGEKMFKTFNNRQEKIKEVNSFVEIAMGIGNKQVILETLIDAEDLTKTQKKDIALKLRDNGYIDKKVYKNILKYVD